MSNAYTPTQQRLAELLYERLRPRLWLMQETLRAMTTDRTSDSVEFCTSSLQGMAVIIGDMRKELDEAVEILQL